jgi:hypothetical protein
MQGIVGEPVKGVEGELGAGQHLEGDSLLGERRNEGQARIDCGSEGCDISGREYRCANHGGGARLRDLSGHGDGAIHIDGATRDARQYVCAEVDHGGGQ